MTWLKCHWYWPSPWVTFSMRAKPTTSAGRPGSSSVKVWMMATNGLGLVLIVRYSIFFLPATIFCANSRLILRPGTVRGRVSVSKPASAGRLLSILTLGPLG